MSHGCPIDLLTSTLGEYLVNYNLGYGAAVGVLVCDSDVRDLPRIVACHVVIRMRRRGPSQGWIVSDTSAMT